MFGLPPGKERPGVFYCEARTRSFEPIEELEARALMSAPVLGDIEFGSTFPTAYQPTRISVDVTDDTGVRAATFFMDRNGNGRWDPFVDQPLGDDFTRDQDGRFSVTATPDGTWPAYPDYARIVADAVDIDGQWATQRPTRTMVFIGLPVISSFWASIVPQFEGQPQPFLQITLAAKVDEPFVYPYGATNVTFFLDRNFNATWDPGVDVDFGEAIDRDDRGYRTRSAVVFGGALGGQLCAVPFRSLSAPGERFGAPVVATFVRQNSSFLPGPPVVTRTLAFNQTNPNAQFFLPGERMRIEFVADTPDTFRDVPRLEAATLFFDANFDQRWTPGVDTDLGAHFFAPDTLRGIGRIEFTVTAEMGFDSRPFVLTTRAGGNWGPTYTAWPKLASRPWIENATPTAPRFAANGTVLLDVESRDDGASRELFAWVDRNNDGIFQLGEAYEQGGLRLGFDPQNFRSQNWRVTITLTGLDYTPGTYSVGIIARDYQGLQGQPRFFTITLV